MKKIDDKMKNLDNAIELYFPDHAKKTIYTALVIYFKAFQYSMKKAPIEERVRAKLNGYSDADDYTNIEEATNLIWNICNVDVTSPRFIELSTLFMDSLIKS